MAEVVKKKVDRFVCSTCGKSYSRKATASMHVGRCPKELSSRACATCRFDGPVEMPGCTKGLRPGDVRCLYDCPVWEAAARHLTNVIEVTIKPVEIGQLGIPVTSFVDFDDNF